MAVGNVACHLAEATSCVLTTAEPYRDPMKVSPKQGQARDEHGSVEIRELNAISLLQMILLL